jgi:glycosyltransferase involved in cell wall biosynthesis
MSLRVSIVTPSYQQGAFIEDTLKSVLEQDYPDLEQWVVDAGSTDQTHGLLEAYAEKYPGRLQWTSEPDDGQSDAINKGFRRATGDIVAWLNADDVYYPGVIRRVAQVFEDRPEVQAVYGKGTFLTRDGTFLTEFPHNQSFDAERLLNGFAFLLQPTVFWRKSVLDEVGDLDLDLHYGMDYDLWCRMAKAGIRFHYDEDRYYAAARFYRETKTASGQWKRSREMRRVARRHSGKLLPAITLFAWIEALMSTPLMTRLYRPLKRRLHGLDIEYWEIPAPQVTGSFTVRFPWYRPVSTVEVDLAASGTAGTVTATREGQMLAECPVQDGQTTVAVPWRDEAREVVFDLVVSPGDLPFRVREVRVRS